MDIGELASQVGGVKGWALGIALTMAAPLAIRWMKRNLPRMIAKWVIAKAKIGLEGKGIANGDLKALVHDVTLALVKYAERKLPDEGLGPQRLALIESALCAVPIVGLVFRWIIRNYPQEWREIVEEAVKAMDSELKTASGSPQEPPKPSGNPPAPGK